MRSSFIILSFLVLCGCDSSSPHFITAEEIKESKPGILVIEDDPDTSYSDMLKDFTRLKYEVVYSDLPAVHTYSFYRDTLFRESIEFTMDAAEEAERAKMWLINYVGQPDSMTSQEGAYVSVDDFEMHYDEKEYYISTSGKTGTIRLVDWWTSGSRVQGEIDHTPAKDYLQK